MFRNLVPEGVKVEEKLGFSCNVHPKNVMSSYDMTFKKSKGDFEIKKLLF